MKSNVRNLMTCCVSVNWSVASGETEDKCPDLSLIPVDVDNDDDDGTRWRIPPGSKVTGDKWDAAVDAELVK